MLRSLIQKLPKLSTTSDYAVSSARSHRNCRSLSPPVHRKHWDQLGTSDIAFSRSISCSPSERGSSLAQIQEKPHQARKLCFTNNEVDSPSDELHWRENPPKESEIVELPPANRPENAQMETLEQYELEAARPRPSKSHELMEAFNSKMHSVDPHCHLQPNQMKPYGSSDNFYSPLLIRPTNSLKFPRKFKKHMAKDNVDNNSVKKSDSKSSVPGKRRFSTASYYANKASSPAPTDKKLGTDCTKTNDIKHLTIPKQIQQANYYSAYWNKISKAKNFEFLPPKFQYSLMNKLEDRASEILEISTPQMRRQRIDEENRRGSSDYKLSYSDLVKQKILEKQQQLMVFNTNVVPSEKKDSGCTVKNEDNKMLKAFKNLPGRRLMTIRSKSTLSSKSVAKKSKKKKGKKAPKPECEDICTDTVRLVDNVKHKNYPYEPKKCETETILSKKLFLPSKVRLAVAPCTQRPDYRDCVKPITCDEVERADDCMEVRYKALPKLEPGPCPCIDPPQPSYSPKMQKLHFKFEDPPRVVCHEPPCQTPRADDSNPPRHKKLKPYKPQDCACVEPPPMFDVKLKRLPRCEPEEVCRPVRVCPEPFKCPPRADDNLQIAPKKLPYIEGQLCPCIEPPAPTIAPPIRRLDLSVPEPDRVCQKKPICAEMPRADDNLAQKKKKLPKFVPGDCPCEDRPMLDWNFKRLVCEDEQRDCIVPDPCLAFPRADWGCWEYQQQECAEIDEKCIDKRVKCPPPKKKKAEICGEKKDHCNWPTTNMNPHHKRKFSNASSSFVPRQTRTENIKPINSSPTIQPTTVAIKCNNPAYQPQPSSDKKKLSRRSKNYNTVNLIEVLNNLEKPGKISDPLMFKPEKHNRVDYGHILKTIAATTPKLDRKDSKSATVSLKKATSINVTSRAISTTKNLLLANEIDMKNKKETDAKKKCKQIKPTIKALMCQKQCPRYVVCPDKPRDFRPACKVERVPVCCSKEESPYSAYTDNLPTTMRPYVTKTPQFNCSRIQYGYYPNFKKEFEPFDADNSGKKPQAADKKHFSTSSIYKSVKEPPKQNPSTSLLTFYRSNPAQHCWRLKGTRCSTAQPPSKDLLTSNKSLHTLSTPRALTTKVFQIYRPVAPKCPKAAKCDTEPLKPPQRPMIVCHTEVECKAHERRPGCEVLYKSCPKKRRRPPFPAFSDCLDEEMEEILTECPLDREKYLRMQPRFMNPTPKPFTLKPPPPIQGKIDILKEQKCIREKLCIENEGFTQTCSEFGKPVPLMKSKDMFPEVNRDCERIVELKKIGRWPPFTLKSSRRRFSTCMSYQTRSFHVLSKGIDKVILKPNEDKDKAEREKFWLNKNKLKENAVPCIKLFIKEIKQNDNNVAKRVQRFYTTFKINRKRSFGSGRRFSNSPVTHKCNTKLYRGNRHYKSSKNVSNKTCPKFTLNNCPAKAVRRPDCKKIPASKSCSKPISPYPAYSECTEHKVITPECECAYDLDTMEDLQPKLALINEPENIKHYPSQEKINRAVGIEYYKCKHGIANEGITIGCESLGRFDKQQSETVEFLVQDHKAAKDINVCSQSPKDDPCAKDRQKLEDMCIRECLKHVPCDLPEEEKYCICKERCAAYFNPKNVTQEEDDVTKSTDVSCEPISASRPRPSPGKDDDDVTKSGDVSCEPVSPLPPRPSPGKDDDVTKSSDVSCEPLKPLAPKPKPQSKIDCAKEQKPKLLKHVECIAPPPKPNPPCKQVVVKAAPCPRKTTQLEGIWQKIVNFFKARPNCPEPGDYKKKALRERAEKAANALGLVVVDPKCLPQDMLKGLKSPKKDCKACPDQKRSFSTTYQQSRRYSNNCKHLEEINRMLEADDELKQNEPTIAIFPARQDALAVEALKMSLNYEVYKFAATEWCNSESSYFGYSDIIPNRVNILERAWRLSIEACNKRNQQKTYSIFNEIFNKVEGSSVKSYEDLEKLKTENILRELDELLKNEEPSKKKK